MAPNNSTMMKNKIFESFWQQNEENEEIDSQEKLKNLKLLAKKKENLKLTLRTQEINHIRTLATQIGLRK